MIEKTAHTSITENVYVGSYINRQGGHPTQTYNINNSSHSTRTGVGGGKREREKRKETKRKEKKRKYPWPLRNRVYMMLIICYKIGSTVFSSG